MEREHTAICSSSEVAGADGELFALWERLRRLAGQLGVGALGVADVEPMAEARAQIESRVASGLTADMNFTVRNPARATEPARLLAGVQSVVVGLWPYTLRGGADAPRFTAAGRVASYVVDEGSSGSAEGGDRSGRGSQYGRFSAALEQIAECVQAAGYEAVVVMDDNRLADRAVAYQAGLGWFGRNTMLLNSSLGSTALIGSVVTTAPLIGVPGAAAQHSPDDAVAEGAAVARAATGGLGSQAPAVGTSGCGDCRACVDACPTGALGVGSDGVATLDANRCLAWLLQADGVFPRRWRVALGDRIYGCDACQTSCPVNVSATPQSATEGECVQASDGANSSTGDGDSVRAATSVASHSSPQQVNWPTGRSNAPWVDLLDLLAATDDVLLTSYGHWYIPRRQPTYLRRNALVALANVANPADPRVAEKLAACLASPSAVVRAHAVWSTRRLGLDYLLADPSFVATFANDNDSLVADELAAAVPLRRDLASAQRPDTQPARASFHQAVVG